MVSAHGLSKRAPIVPMTPKSGFGIRAKLSNTLQPVCVPLIKPDCMEITLFLGLGREGHGKSASIVS
jgi:hypothetical protein